MKCRFSIHHREEKLIEASRKKFDLIVIGGGITGAGILLDAQSRGLSTLLIEMQDFAAGTSSRSTKLIHGGLRYLKQGEVGLVAEVGRERAIVYENGPHVTKPEWMLLPIVKGGSLGKWTTSLGLAIYDFLAKVKKEERRVMLSKKEALEKEPLLRKEGLIGAGYYVEYRTDDARLTLEVLKKAVEYGATAFNYIKAESFLYRDGKVIGVRAVDQLSEQVWEFEASKVVNATGPWCDELREKDGSKTGKHLRWTKGVHLVVDQRRFPLKQAVYFDTSDRRMVFAIPRDGKTYIGTTDTDYHGDLIHPPITKDDRDYLLDAVNHMFPTVQLTPADVESGWAGIRPLIHEEGKAPSELSRKDEIFHSDSGLITITGGKLTGYRKMAERTVDLVIKHLEKKENPLKDCHTDQIPISGGDIGGSENWQPFVTNKLEEGLKVGLCQDEAHRLIHLYGSNVSIVFEQIQSGKKVAEFFNLPLDVYGMLRYGIDYEMVATPADFFVRRTGALFFNIDWVKRWKEAVISLMKEEFGWSKEKENQERYRLQREIDLATRVVFDE